MRYYEFKTTTPQQARINQVKQQKELASANLKAEKDRQKKASALANIQKNNEVLAKLNKSF
jgi:hypothetical protein